MKNIFFAVGFVFVMLLLQCGPAAEDRQYMHERAKIFQDSIANFIRGTMAEAEGPAAVQPVVVSPAPAQQPPASGNSGK